MKSIEGIYVIIDPEFINNEDPVEMTKKVAIANSRQALRSAVGRRMNRRRIRRCQVIIILGWCYMLNRSPR